MRCRGRVPGGYRAVPKPRVVGTEADGEHQVRMRRRTREKRFQALRQNAPLRIAGELEDSYYVLPFKHNSSFDRTLNYSSKWFENVFGYMVINPLETRILDLSPKKDKVLFGSVPNAVLITAQTKTGEGAPFFDIGWKPEVEKDPAVSRYR